LISALAHNFVRQFQLSIGAAARPNGRKRTHRWVFESLRTFRYEILNLPAKIACPAGRAQLRIAAVPETQRRIAQILDALPESA
jgi:hypothetical protein